MTSTNREDFKIPPALMVNSTDSPCALSQESLKPTMVTTRSEEYSFGGSSPRGRVVRSIQYNLSLWFENWLTKPLSDFALSKHSHPPSPCPSLPALTLTFEPASTTSSWAKPYPYSQCAFAIIPPSVFGGDFSDNTPSILNR